MFREVLGEVSEEQAKTVWTAIGQFVENASDAVDEDGWSQAQKDELDLATQVLDAMNGALARSADPNRSRNPAFTTSVSWSQVQIRTLGREISKAVEPARPFVSSEIYRDMIRSRALGILMGQHRNSIPVVAIAEFLAAIEIELGVAEQD